MTTEEALKELLTSTKELIRTSEQLLDSNHYKLRYGNFEFTTALRNTQKTTEKIENERK